jgi:hypothetical protein
MKWGHNWFYAEDVNLLTDDMNIIKKTTGTPLIVNRVVWR